MVRKVLRAALLIATFSLAKPAAAQNDVIRGRVTDQEGLALGSVRVTATSIPGNVTREVRTNGKGDFQLVFPGGTGDYMMGYALIGYVYKQQEIKRLADEDVLVANASLSVVQLDTIAIVASVQQKVNRNQSTPDVSGTERQINTNNLTADQQGDLAAMAASLPGVLLVPGIDGAADGFSVLGAGADQNTQTLNGLPLGQSGLPRDAQISSSLTTSPYDVTKGGFSGGNFNVTAQNGSNFRTRGMSWVINVPQLEWTDRAAQAVGAEYTNVSNGGIVSGPLILNKAFYNISYQLGRNERDNQTLLGNNALGFQTAGVSKDSVARFLNILANNNVPGLGGGLHPDRLSDNGSFLGRINIQPPSSTTGQSLGFTFNGAWGHQSPAFGGITQLPSASGDRTNYSGGLQASHSAYVGMVLSETNAGLNLSHNWGDPYLNLPAGRVLVTSDLTSGSGVQNLSFGGSQNLSSTSRTLGTTFQNTLSWFDDANKHRVKLGTELNYSEATTNPASNMLGTFSYNSLADLENGIPAAYSRTLSVNERTTGQLNGAVSLGDSYRKTQDLQFQYGLRADAIHYTTTPTFNPAVLATFGRHNDHIPTPVSISPRVGFSYTLGDANEISFFSGQFRAPRAVIRGGVAVLTNSGGGDIGSAIDNTGLATGAQQLLCVGSAVPTPNWVAYGTGSPVDSTCRGGAPSSFVSTVPNVTLFADNFRPSRSVRSNFSWNGAILDARFTLGAEATYSLNLNQQRQVDLNFDNVARFTLPAEGRPVYVDTSSIVTTTGQIAARDARITQSFARVSEIRSDMQSRTAQLSLRLNPIYRTPVKFRWNAAYTLTDVREQVNGFNSTAGSPLGVSWARSSQGPHQISYGLNYTFFSAFTVSWNGQFRSGSYFTPLVAGDINGDGYFNDRAFIYPTTTTADSATRVGMASLLANAAPSVRSCLAKQIGRVASRNSCKGPWSSSASLNISLDRAKFHMPQRALVSFSLSNPLGAADLIVNGSNHLKGWGQTPTPDASLLYVKGFDPVAKQYRYEVNQRFGNTRPQFLTLRQPVVLTTSVRIDLGATRERQNVEQWVGAGRDRPGSRLAESFYRQSGPGSVLNPLSTILRSQDTLKLTAKQADSIAVLNRHYTYRADSIWAPVGKKLGTLGTTYDINDAYAAYIKARRAQIDLLIKIVNDVN
ncbi:MAG TPA: TonB-dependent receptor, partial [Gemmatimonadaceae bacterium]